MFWTNRKDRSGCPLYLKIHLVKSEKGINPSKVTIPPRDESLTYDYTIDWQQEHWSNFSKLCYFHSILQEDKTFQFWTQVKKLLKDIKLHSIWVSVSFSFHFTSSEFHSECKGGIAEAASFLSKVQVITVFLVRFGGFIYLWFDFITRILNGLITSNQLIYETVFGSLTVDFFYDLSLFLSVMQCFCIYTSLSAEYIVSSMKISPYFSISLWERQPYLLRCFFMVNLSPPEYRNLAPSLRNGVPCQWKPSYKKAKL